MNRLLTISALALLTGCAELPPSVQHRETAFQLANGLDAASTLYMMNQPNKWQETNPILGLHPSHGQILAYMSGLGAIHYGVTLALDELNAPSWLMKSWQYTSIGVSSGFVINNAVKFNARD